MEPSGDWKGAPAVSRYGVTLAAKQPLDLPPYLGSTIRGALGSVLRRLSCPAGSGGRCVIPGGCPYHQLFDVSLPPGFAALSGFGEIPRPFIIAPPANGGTARRVLALGERLAFEEAAPIRLAADRTYRTTWERYSSRQGRRMRRSGIAGEAIYDGDFSPFYPCLVLGQWAHVGKGATFGLGRYVIEPA